MGTQLDRKAYEDLIMDFLKEIEMQKQIAEDYIEEEKKRYAEEQKHNKRIFKAIEKTLGKEYLEAVLDCLRESEAQGKLELVRNPQIKKQYEDWDVFDHVLVDQYVDGGYVGDDFAGDVYIPLKVVKNKKRKRRTKYSLYLKSYYEM